MVAHHSRTTARGALVGILLLATAACSGDASRDPVEQFNRDRCELIDSVAQLPDGVYPGACSVQRFDTDGAEVKLEVWTYDAFGYPLSKRESEDGHSSGWTQTYYTIGLAATREVDFDGDAEPDRRFQYVVNDDCLTTSALVDEGNGGIYTGEVVYRYDDQDRLLGRDFDYDGDGELELETEVTYDTDGNATRSEVYVGGSDEAYAVVTYTYDDTGNLLLEEKNEPVDAHINERTEYDADGRLLREEKDEDEDGIMDVTVTYSHDEAGNTLIGEISQIADGASAGQIVHKYDCWADWTGR